MTCGLYIVCVLLFFPNLKCLYDTEEILRGMRSIVLDKGQI